MPEFYGFVHARRSELGAWATYGVMEHIEGRLVGEIQDLGVEWWHERHVLEAFLKKVRCGHSDLHGGNAMIAGPENGLVVIDWESRRLFGEEEGWGPTRFTRIVSRVRGD